MTEELAISQNKRIIEMRKAEGRRVGATKKRGGRMNSNESKIREN